MLIQGAKFTPAMLQASKDRAILKKEVFLGNIERQISCKLILEQTDLEDCADAFVSAAKNSSLTGQNIQIGMKIDILSSSYFCEFQRELPNMCLTIT